MKNVFKSFLILIVGFFIVKAFKVQGDIPLLESIDGASIRTKTAQTEQGLRFYASIDESVKNNEHGFYLVYGDVTVLELEGVINDQSMILNGKEVFKVVVPGVTLENQFNVVLTGIAEVGYLDKLSVIPYVVLEGNVNLFSNPVTRSIGEIAVKMEIDEGNAPTDVLSKIKRVYPNAFGNFVVSSSLFEDNHFELNEKFAEDWNNKFQTSFLNIVASDFYESAQTGSIDLEQENANLSETNLYKFFNDPIYQDKWGWLLDYLESVDNVINPSKQIVAIRGDGTNGTNKLYNGNHLSYSISNFFNQENEKSDYTPIDFTQINRYDTLMNFNNKVYIRDTDYDFYLIGSDITVPNPPEIPHYEFIEYKDGEVYLQPGLHIVIPDDLTLEAIYNPINYNVTFYDGTNELIELEFLYNIEDPLLPLPDYNKEGHIFLGWYNNAEFRGEPITSIEFGSIGDKTFYAKLQQTSNVPVNVTYKLNRGMLQEHQVIEYRDIEHIIATRYSDCGDNLGENITVGPDRGGLHWYTMAFKETEIGGFYEFIGQGVGYQNPEASLYVSYHDNVEGVYAASIQTLYSNIVLGDLAYIPVLPPSFMAVTEVHMHFLKAGALTDDVNETLIAPTNLFIPVRFGANFLGWYDNAELTGEPINIYPGYVATDNITNITYYAKWDINEALVHYDFGHYGYISNSVTKVDIYEEFVGEYKTLFGRTESTVQQLMDDFAAKGYFTEDSGFIEEIFSETHENGKWSWLRDYIIDVASITSYGELNNLLVWDQATWRTNLEAFFNNKQFNYDNLIESMDFTSNIAANGFWRYTPYNRQTNILSEPLIVSSTIQSWDQDYIFAGFYDNPEFSGQEITTLPPTSDRDLTIYAKWVEDIALVYYDFGEYGYISNGVTKTNIYEEFVTDYKELYGRTGSTVEQLMANFTELSYIPGNIEDIFSETYKDGKWSWLSGYILGAATETSYANLSDLESYHQTYWRVNIEAFFNDKSFTFQTATEGPFVSIDFSSNTAANSFWKYLPYNKDVKTINDPLILGSNIQSWDPNYEFAGFYDNPEFTGNKVTTIPSSSTLDINLYTKWQLIQ